MLGIVKKMNTLEGIVDQVQKEIKELKTEFRDTLKKNQRPITPSSPTDDVFRPFEDDQVLGAQTAVPAINRKLGEMKEEIEKNRRSLFDVCSEFKNSTERLPEPTDMTNSAETKKPSSSTKRSNKTDEKSDQTAKKAKIEAPEVDKEKPRKIDVDNGNVEKDKIEKRKTMAERIEMPKNITERMEKPRSVESTEDIKRRVEDRLRSILSGNDFKKIKSKKKLLDGVEDLYNEYRDNTDAIKSFMAHKIQNQRNCVLCGFFHFSETCEKITLISKRKEKLKQTEHCMICTKRHKGLCVAKLCCKICSNAKNHNRLLLAGLDHPPMFCPLQEEYHQAMAVRDALRDAKTSLAELDRNKKCNLDPTSY